MPQGKKTGKILGVTNDCAKKKKNGRTQFNKNKRKDKEGQ